jgi:carboxymethylenebutenolidase
MARRRIGFMLSSPGPAAACHGRPEIIVIQEWWGLNDQICGVADRFARAGYNALAPDLYKRRLTTEPDEANHLMTGLDFPAATHQDLRGAALELQKHRDKVAVMGFCMDGALTIAAAVHIREINAAAASTAFRPRILPIRPRFVCRFRGTSPTRTIGAHRPRSTISRRC